MPRRSDISKGMPSYKDLINPTIEALQSLGGSGSVNEIYNKVLKRLALPEKIVDFPHAQRTSQSEIQYRLAWARTYLKNFGVIESTSRGVWVITPTYKDTRSIDVNECVNSVRALFSSNTSNPDNDEDGEGSIDLPEEVKPWRIKLHDILLSMDPFAFERLTQRMLRESGFAQVEVTKKTGDGGIDGFGKLMISGLVGFKVAFSM